ncbi:hypothetical protein PM032_16170 [Halorubrum ezzemoulense]|uniref:hypothetical protein n=1 Tax=Halorubrum ezzemoulense TaxID=337243 RepID=UPI0023305BD0|nr:hypothetical protein [Halorubrum ezzemoulense]MDB2272533.1 hypothetical protein [Halorubrum ezzemoulense]
MNPESVAAATSGRTTLRTIAQTIAMSIGELRRRDPVLFAVAAINAVLFGAFAVGIVLDPMVVNGEPAWLKPAKFAGSIALVCATLGWLSVHLPVDPDFRRRVSRIVGVGLLIEIVLIGGQAARGVGSHFNRATVLDGAIGGVMGVTIVVVTVAIGALAVRARNNEFDVHPAFAAGILLGIGWFVVGAFEGAAMIAIQSRVVETAEPTVPVVGWQLVGDFRLAHFVGLHALQLLPLTGYLAAVGHRRGLVDHPRRVVFLVATGYVAVLFTTAALGVAPALV